MFITITFSASFFSLNISESGSTWSLPFYGTAVSVNFSILRLSASTTIMTPLISPSYCFCAWFSVRWGFWATWALHTSSSGEHLEWITHCRINCNTPFFIRWRHLTLHAIHTSSIRWSNLIWTTICASWCKARSLISRYLHTSWACHTHSIRVNDLVWSTFYAFSSNTNFLISWCFHALLTL